MEYRLFGGSGLKVPVLSFGTGTFGGGNEFFKAWGSRMRSATSHQFIPTGINASLLNETLCP